MIWQGRRDKAAYNGGPVPPTWQLWILVLSDTAEYIAYILRQFGSPKDFVARYRDRQRAVSFCGPRRFPVAAGNGLRRVPCSCGHQRRVPLFMWAPRRVPLLSWR